MRGLVCWVFHPANEEIASDPKKGALSHLTGAEDNKRRVGYPTKCLPLARKMEIAHVGEQFVCFFNLVQFGEIEREKPQFFCWLLDYLDGGEI